ncbi:unnamed protein product [Amoebophrya sp. A25]|nr:unnamed protein product [Amoebophrya sp. A25]|eukprot:GSA25T00027215001.1
MALKDMQTELLDDIEMRVYSALLDFCDNRATKSYDDARKIKSMVLLADSEPAFQNNTPQQIGEMLNEENTFGLFMILSEQREADSVHEGLVKVNNKPRTREMALL